MVWKNVGNAYWHFDINKSIEEERIMKKLLLTWILIAVLLTCGCLTAYSESVTANAGTEEYTDLSKGSKGEDVKQLQTRLKELGFYASGIDGDYGNGTMKAISAFQSRNGLEIDGAATVEVQRVLFSADAKAAPYELPVYNSYVDSDTAGFYYDVGNKGDEAIDSVRCIELLFGTDGEIVCNQTMSASDNYITKDWGCLDTIKPGGKMGLQGDVGWPMSVAKKAAVAVISYHTASGTTVYVDPDQLTFRYSDGTIQYPEEDVEPYVVSDADATELAAIKLGYTTKNLYPWTADFYSVDEGLYLLEVQPGTLADKAGLKTGDIVTMIDGQPAIEIKSTHDAQRKLLNGESVEYTYSRNGSIGTTIISTDMDTISNTDEVSKSDLTIGEELLRYGELLEKELITQEEYDTLKQKLIYG